nr:Spo0E family sporulation regulatory protein-aspartic acid phosphatase [uncultured Metabacillus sp.]
MILKNALELKKRIISNRMDLYKLAKEKSLSDPDVLDKRCQLDKEIMTLHKLINRIHSS